MISAEEKTLQGLLDNITAADARSEGCGRERQGGIGIGVQVLMIGMVGILVVML